MYINEQHSIIILSTIFQISRLTATQLSDMGITLVGHQKKILHQARQLS